MKLTEVDLNLPPSPSVVASLSKPDLANSEGSSEKSKLKLRSESQSPNKQINSKHNSLKKTQSSKKKSRVQDKENSAAKPLQPFSAHENSEPRSLLSIKPVEESKDFSRLLEDAVDSNL